MNKLNATLLPTLSLPHTPRVPRPERVLQFGEGGFLRAFVLPMLDAANAAGALDTSVVVVQPIPQGLTAALDAQDGLYTLLLRGKADGQVVREARVVTAISRTINPYADYAALLACARNPVLRFVVSNTTEAGIAYTGQDGYDDAPPASFPGKVTRLLHERFLHFAQAPDKGLVLLPCELIDANGDALRDCVLRTAAQWGLGQAFADWLTQHCVFANTLVDRIVTGYPRGEAEALWAEWGYQDDMADVGEPFGLWVIEGPESLADELPLHRAGLPVRFTRDVTPYKLRKVRMLNGAHTATVLAAYLAGFDTVGACMADPDTRAFLLHALRAEIMPTLALPRDELEAFAASILERFENPFNRHELLSIALNSVSKWRARILPTLRDHLRAHGTPPPLLAFSLAALLAFYRCQPTADGYRGMRGDTPYPVADDAPVLAFFAAHGADSAEALTDAALRQTAFWGEDLTALPGLTAAVAHGLEAIRTRGAAAAMRAALAAAQ